MVIKLLQIICVTTVFFFAFQQVTYSDINSGDKKGKASTLSSSRADQSRSNPNDDSYRPVTPSGIKPPQIPALTLRQPVPSQSTKSNVGPYVDPPTLGDDFIDCGQACLYQKAIEQLAYMIVFLSEKINDLKSTKRTNDLKSTKRTNDDIRATLDDFCISDDVSGQMIETIQECKERYIALHDLWIIDARKAILQISDMAAKLNDSSTGKDKQWNFEIMRLVRNPPLKPQVPYLYTWADLEQISKNLKQAPDFNYDLYIDNLPTQLQKEDFVDYKEIPRDPKNPSLGTLSVIERNKDGTPKYREKEYQAALQYFDPAFVTKMEKYKKIMKADKQRVLAQMRDWDTKTAEKTTKLFHELSQANSIQGATTPNRNKQYIDDSRGKIIYSVNSQRKQTQNQKKDPKTDRNTHALDSRGVATAQQRAPDHFIGNEQIDEASTNVPGSDSTSIYIKGPVKLDWYNDWFRWNLSLPPPAPSP